MDPNLYHAAIGACLAASNQGEKMFGKRLLKVSVAVAALNLALPSVAQENETRSLDTVIVTATKRPVSILDVPQSIQAVTGDQLGDLAVNNVEDVVALVPNFNVDPGRKYGGQFNIRGFGDQGGAIASFSTVGVYVDETPMTDGFANLDSALYDLERVEVLRGPQGTLYGEGSLAGTVRLVTNKPELNEYQAEILGRAETTEDGDSSYRVAGFANLPIAEDRAALRITASYDDVGGFMDSTPYPGGTTIEEDTNGRKSSYLRAALKLEPTENLTLLPSIVYQKNKAQAGPIDSIALPDLVGWSNGPDSFQDDLYIYALEAEYRFDGATVTSSTSYSDRAFDSVDDDLEANTLIQLLVGPSPFTTQFFTRDIETFSQEFRLASDTDSALSWIVGAFYRKKNIDEDVVILSDVLDQILGDPRTFLQDNVAEFEQYAVFGEVSYELTDKLTVTGGARWFDETANSDLSFGVFDAGIFSFVQNPRIQPTFSEDGVLFKLATTYEASNDLTFYGLYSEGYRPGGVNDRLVDIGGLLTPEELTQLSSYGKDETQNYEIGMKSRFLDGRATANLAVFFIDWSGTQISSEPQPGVNVVVNADGAESTGFEFDGVFRATANLDIGGSVGYAKSEIASDTLSSIGIIPKGAQLAHAPEWSGNIYADYTRPLSPDVDLRLRLDARYTDDRVNRVNIVGSPGVPLDEYTTLNALLAFEADDWSLNLYANNLTNELAETDALLFNGGPFGDAIAGFVRNRPRTIGIQVQKSF